MLYGFLLWFMHKRDFNQHVWFSWGTAKVQPSVYLVGCILETHCPLVANNHQPPDNHCTFTVSDGSISDYKECFDLWPLVFFTLRRLSSDVSFTDRSPSLPALDHGCAAHVDEKWGDWNTIKVRVTEAAYVCKYCLTISSSSPLLVHKLVLYINYTWATTPSFTQSHSQTGQVWLIDYCKLHQSLHTHTIDHQILHI